MVNFEECTGCSACSAICSHKAIKMTPDKGGFLHPVINNDICINCGLCDKVCELANTVPNSTTDNIIALKHNNSEVIERSTSGGAFYLIAKYVLDRGGVVYDENWNVVHERCNTLSDLKRIQKSKYVQSDVSRIYGSLTEDLKSGKMVLFSGTACQCNGIKAFAKRKRLNEDLLITCDVICHGVPSPKLWSDYIDFREEKSGKITDVDFRYKKKSWRDFRMYLKHSNGREYTYRKMKTFL